MKEATTFLTALLILAAVCGCSQGPPSDGNAISGSYVSFYIPGMT